jgi:cytochrome c553
MNVPLRIRMVAAAISILCVSACDNMQHQENARSFVASRHFADDSSARMPPAHTISRSASGPDDPVATGMHDGKPLVGFPVPLTRDFVIRGGERYGIFCADCHGADGAGRGIIVARGFPRPVSFHTLRMRSEPAGELYTAIAHGRGVMYGFADRIGPADRWAIVAFIRALQKSRNATLAEVPDEERARLTTQ